MKLLVLAQTPPPAHGQSIMVQAMVEGLPSLGITVRHVPFSLSRTHDSIGRWHPSKVLTAMRAALAARRMLRNEAFDALYYVPAPGKRGALWRDIVVLGLVRGSVPRLVLHWHAPGLGEWLDKKATMIERAAATRALGRADLSIVLAESLRGDASVLLPKRIEVVANGVPDPGPPSHSSKANEEDWRVLFLGQCTKEKGLFVSVEAVLEANRRLISGSRAERFTLTVAGPFLRTSDSEAFASLAKQNPGVLVYVGEVSGDSKRDLLRNCDCLCSPTSYPHEGQPLVILEALANDIPVVATRWRAIAETLPNAGGILVPPGDSAAVAHALISLRDTRCPPGTRRALFLKEFTIAEHLRRLSYVLGTLILDQNVLKPEGTA
jgi:glycosyltransferase involved in cell wall biosynthesis